MTSERPAPRSSRRSRPGPVGSGPARPPEAEGWSRVRGLIGSLRGFFYGMTAYAFERHALGERARLEDLFVLITLGDLIGVPIIPPYYSLRLLPYAVPRLEAWKRRLLRERHVLEQEEYDLIEL